MSFIVNPFRFSSEIFAHYAACDGNNADLYDPGNYASAGNLVVPSLWAGRKIRFSAGNATETGATTTFSMARGGSNFDGAGKLTGPSLTGAEFASIASAPLVASAADTFTTTNIGTTNGWKCLEVLTSGLKSALVNRITSSFSVGAAFTVVEWNNEVYDTDAFHDNSTNPSRLTVPSGVTNVRVSCSVTTANSTGEVGIQILKNGAALTLDMQYDQSGASNNICAMSLPLSVTSSDYFEVQVRTTAATNVAIDNNSWFAIEEVPYTPNYAVANRSSNIAITSGSYNAVAMNNESVDTGGFYTSGDSFFTVPSGVTRIRTGFFVQKSATGDFGFQMRKNGAVFSGMAASASANASNDYAHGISSILEVTTGDTFDFYQFTSAGAQTLQSNSFVWIEEIPAITS